MITELIKLLEKLNDGTITEAEIIELNGKLILIQKDLEDSYPDVL
jgi:hypothetical protein